VTDRPRTGERDGHPRWRLFAEEPGQEAFLGESTHYRFRRKWWRAALPLLWLIAPISEVLGTHHSTAELVLVAIGVLAFVLAYILGSLGGRLEPVLGFVVLLVLGALLTLLGSVGFAILFVYAAAAAGVRLRSRALAGVLLCTVLTGTLSPIAGASLGTALSLTAVTVSIGAMMLAFGRLITANIELECARHELARVAVDDERMRFARDLHDLLGHSLSVIALKAELAGRLLREDTEAAAVHVGELEGVARKALSEVREAVSGYRRPVLAAELDGARMALEAAGIDARLERPQTALAPDIESLLAWTVREGTTNVIRHSGASSCRVAIQPGLLAASAEVLDDGRGPGEADVTGNGLAGLRERVERLAGKLETGRGPDGGFRLRVTVPTANSQSRV
jgi:two-component system sensor histidine kinase DesK